jgi:hypothetical protein
MKERTKDMTNKMMTLENYCERYVPLTILKVVRRVVEPVVHSDEEKKNAVIKVGNIIMNEMVDQIIGD